MKQDDEVAVPEVPAPTPHRSRRAQKTLPACPPGCMLIREVGEDGAFTGPITVKMKQFALDLIGAGRAKAVEDPGVA